MDIINIANQVIKYVNAYQINAAIDEKLVIGSKLKICHIYNRIFQIQQYFNCQNYGHSISKYVKLFTCYYCIDTHILKKSKNKFAVKCAIYGSNHKTYNQKYHKKKKKIDCIIAICLSTTNLYTIIPCSSSLPNIPYFFLETTIPLSINNINTVKKQLSKSI